MINLVQIVGGLGQCAGDPGLNFFIWFDLMQHGHGIFGIAIQFATCHASLIFVVLDVMLVDVAVVNVNTFYLCNVVDVVVQNRILVCIICRIILVHAIIHAKHHVLFVHSGAMTQSSQICCINLVSVAAQGSHFLLLGAQFCFVHFAILFAALFLGVFVCPVRNTISISVGFFVFAFGNLSVQAAHWHG